MIPPFKNREPRKPVAKVVAIFSMLVFLLIAASGCSRAYYGAMEKIGFQKRDILVSRVKKAKEAQEETKEEFASALDAYMAVVDVPKGDLEQRYRTLLAAYERSKSQADELDGRIDAVEDVAEALFREWENEIREYTNKKLAASSKEKLRDTRRKYEPMVRAMREAQSKVDPVLSAFNDQVLYLKHNLNAQAIQALKGEVRGVRSDVATLVREMERSISESEQFIAQMNQ